MNAEQALALLAKAARDFKGTGQDHDLINQALQILQAAISKQPGKKGLKEVSKDGDKS